MKILLPSVFALFACSGAMGADWHSTDDSTFSFETTFEGEPIGGNFGRFDVRFDFDPAVPGEARLVVTVGLAAADMGDADMNAVLFDEAWFDTARFDTAEFESNSIEKQPEQGFVAVGSLKLKGFERTVSVPFSWSCSGDTARMRGEFSLDRTDFDVGTGEWSTGDTIGLEVRLVFDVSLEPAD